MKNSYVDQQIAVAGIEYNTLACNPLKNPNGPAIWWIWLIGKQKICLFLGNFEHRQIKIKQIFTCIIASLMPRVRPIPVSWVFSNVFITSNGVVKADAIAPAAPPATTCTPGLYLRSLFNYKYKVKLFIYRFLVRKFSFASDFTLFCKNSYVEKWSVWWGKFIHNCVV